MFSQPYEPVIGRHGLVSDGFLLWKVGVKNVYNNSEKLVEAFPHLPHHSVEKSHPIRLLPRIRHSNREFPRPKHTDLSTHKMPDITDTNTRLSPTYTGPTITTITYINRRGRTE